MENSLHDVYVPGRGPLDAKLVVLGEAPGYREAVQRRPFVGSSGQLLEQWIREAGIDLATIRYENVYPFYPPAGVSGPEGNINNVPEGELKQWQQDCLVRMDRCSSAIIYVPVGNVALSTLTGKQGITNWRGSIMSFWRQSTGTYVKVIPTIHPAAILYQRKRVAQKQAGAQQGATPLWEKRCRHDWARITADLAFPELGVPERNLIIRNQEIALQELRADIRDGKPLAIDIETIPAEGKITCVGFATAPHWAVSLPFSAAWKPDIQALCECNAPKIMQNGFYDFYWLARKANIHVENYIYDTRWLMHCLDPLEPGSLAYMASIFTREPFYKPSGEDEENFFWANSGASWYELLEYNAKDAAVTWEVWNALVQKIDTTLYHRLYSTLYYPLLRMMLHGVPVDEAACQVAYTESYRLSQQERDTACAIAGRPLYTLKTQAEKLLCRAYDGYSTETDSTEALEKALRRGKRTRDQIEADIAAMTISNQHLMKVLREHGCTIPKSHKNIDGDTLNDTALKSLKLKYGQQKPAVFALIEATERHRKARKLSEFFQVGKYDDDYPKSSADSEFNAYAPRHVMRCEYGFTVTNRCKSRHNPFGTGANLQNIPQAARGVYIPLPGHIFLSVDLSQAEARDVYMRTRDSWLIQLARSKPWETDIHIENASIFYEVAADKVTAAQRQESKVIEHATNYGMGAHRLQQEFLDNGMVKSLKECERLLARKFALKPGILDWQQRIRMEVMQKRRLVNAWGREITLDCMPLNDVTYQFAYAWKPQSDIGIMMNQWGVIPLDDIIERYALESRLLLQEHDGLTVSCAVGEAYRIACHLQVNLEQNIWIEGHTLSIPCEFKLATTWRTDKQAISEGKAIELKQLPDECEFMAAIRELKR